MLRNLFKTSLVALLKAKTTLILNVSGLAIGIAACLLAYLHIDYELSYDGHFSQKEQLYRLVVGDMETGDGWVKVSAPIPPIVEREIPEVEAFARMTEYSYNEKVAVAFEDVVFNETNIYLVDRNLFDFFDIELSQGSLGAMFPENAIYLSEKASQKLFRTGDPIGKVLEVGGKERYVIRGVFPSFPENSHFTPDYLVSFDNLEKVLPNTSLLGNWGQFNYFAYLRLTEGADLINVIQKIKSQVVSFGNDQEMKFEDLTLQALQDIHFQSSPGNVKASYERRYLYVYAAIAIAIFAISLINFLNLTIASSTRRIKEVGVRKVMGATRQQLFLQFISEGFILSGLAIFAGIGLVQFGLPAINQLVGSKSAFDFSDPTFYAFAIGLVGSIALLSGVYISTFVISFHPVRALKGGVKIGRKGASFRNGLLVTQFMMSTVLLLSSVLIYQQLNYMRTSALGLDKEQLLTLQFFDEGSKRKLETLATELEKLPEVRSTATSRFIPGESNWNQTVRWDGQEETDSWNVIDIGPGFLETYGIELVEGDLEAIRNRNTEQWGYLVNEAAVRRAGWDHGLGQSFSAQGTNGFASILGVTKDFHFRSMHNAIDPVVLIIRDNERNNQLTLKLESDDYASLMPQIRGVYQNVLGNVPFDYAFVDSQFEELYRVEEQTMQLIGLLTVVAIVLAMLGMYALLSYTIRERTKEIAIRKVLGINIKATLMLLASRYLKLLIVANLVGIPLTWYLLSRWLENFSYHIELNPGSMILFSLLTFVILLAVVGSKAIQTDRINPTDALRSE